MSSMPVLRRLLLVLALTVPAVAGLGGCRTNPATGERVLALLSPDQEARLGAEAAPQFTAEFGGAVDDPLLQGYVTEVGMQLAAHTEDYFPGIDWEFTLLDSAMVNAFALPGGKVFITRGLAARLEDESELAGVIGHEIGHVTALHANQRLSKEQAVAVLLAGVTAVLATTDEGSTARQVGSVAVPALVVGSEVVQLRFGRGEELEADRLGMRYMSRGGWDPSGQRRVMEVLAALSAGGGRPPEWLSTHPYPETRISEIDRLLAQRYADFRPASGDGRFAGRYRQRMLDRLSRLGPPGHAALAPEDEALLAAAVGCRHVHH